MGAAYIHAARVRVEQAVAGEAQALESYQKALDIAERASVVAEDALSQRDAARRENEALQAECEKLADQRESALYDRDCLEEKLREEESRHEATLAEAMNLGFDFACEYAKLENEHERLEKENDQLRQENSTLQLASQFDALSKEVLVEANESLKDSNRILRNSLSMKSFEALVNRLKKAESALASAQVVTMILLPPETVKQLRG